MSEKKISNSESGSRIRTEVISFRDRDEMGAAIAAIEDMIHEEVSPFSDGKGDIKSPQGRHVFRLWQADTTIKKIEQEWPDSQDSFVVFAKEREEVVGFFLVCVSGAKNKSVTANFVGMRFSHGGKGIATNMVAQGNEYLLKNLGISEYEVTTWEGSESVFRKTSENMIEVSDSSDSGRSQFIVQLRTRG